MVTTRSVSSIIPVTGSSYVTREGMKASQVLEALKKMQYGGPKQVLNITIRTCLPALPLHQIDFAPQPFYAIASSRPFAFGEFVDLVFSFGERLLKAWMICEREGEVRHEVSLSNFGVSLDGQLRTKEGLQQGVDDYIRCHAPSVLRGQPFYIGQNAGVLLLGEPQEHGGGIEAVPEKVEVSFKFLLHERDNYIRGAVSVEKLETAVLTLLGGENFLGLEFIQPALSVLVRRARIYRDRLTNTFGGEYALASVSKPIAENLCCLLL